LRPSEDSDPRLLLLSPGDSIYVLRDQVAAGETIRVAGVEVTVPRTLGLGHKIARVAHAEGDKVVKYGAPIGSVTVPIRVGEHVHTQNLKSDHTATYTLEAARAAAEGRA